MSLRLPVELEVPGAKLSSDPSGWRTSKTVTIKDSYSPVGIVKYEYRIGTGSPNNSENVTSSLLTKTNPTRYVASAIANRTDGYCPESSGAHCPDSPACTARKPQGSSSRIR